MKIIKYHPAIERPTILEKLQILSKKEKVLFAELILCAIEQDFLFTFK